jgi:Do/DeqQ family serine protease|tara:strand:- start:14105 stop:15226 length:1122 start_codon:yes stop_codon:yes gene_type:complete
MKRIWILFSQTTTVLLAAYFVVLTLKPQWVVPERDTVAVGSTAPATLLRSAAQAASPAVVSIQAISGPQLDDKSTTDPWFKFFFDEDQRGEPASNNIGSGVIVSASGHVLTNNHVIQNAQDIQVTLLDGRRVPASVLGTDPDTDLAVLKIQLNALPNITLGDSNALFVGDSVLAIGNPFGVGQTVTSGIVSALGRSQLGINTYENFIQTDAAINPGNSGGALVNSSGHLVGINTAIYSRSGGSMGIGFAIPTSVAKQVLDDIVSDGFVTRGWIGVEPQTLNAELASSFGLNNKSGVLVAGVLKQGPAATAGVIPGDVITAIDEQPVASVADLLGLVSELTPGTSSQLKIWRDGKAQLISIRPAARPYYKHGSR